MKKLTIIRRRISPMTLFTLLPDDMMEYILKDLDFKSLSYFSKTCKLHHEMTDAILTRHLISHIIFWLFSVNKTWCEWEEKSDTFFCMDLSSQAIGKHENEFCVMLTLTKAKMIGERYMKLQPFWSSLLHSSVGMTVLKEQACRDSRHCNHVTVDFVLLMGERLLITLKGFINLQEEDNNYFVILWEYVSFQVMSKK